MPTVKPAVGLAGLEQQGARLVRLDDPMALDASLTGAKAANLARAAAVGLPVLPGVVLTTGQELLPTEDPEDIELAPAVVAALEEAFLSLTDGGRQRLVVRSSSTAEDLGTSSMAGRFRSVLGVDETGALLAAVRLVLASSVSTAASEGGLPLPMAVLVQRQLRTPLGGVLFGVDPLDAASKTMLVEVCTEGPEPIVSGRVAGEMVAMGRRGRLIEADATARKLLPFRLRRRLARLARAAASMSGAPQDVEWALDEDGNLWLLQTRPVTAASRTPHDADGPLLGPGPLAETFPLALRPLEADLWLSPLRAGMAEALSTLGVVGPRRLRRSPLVTCVQGSAVCDLQIVGIAEHPSRWRSLAPAPALRHLRSAWRVGSLRAGLTKRAQELASIVDRELEEVPESGSRMAASIWCCLLYTSPSPRDS